MHNLHPTEETILHAIWRHAMSLQADLRVTSGAGGSIPPRFYEEYLRALTGSKKPEIHLSGKKRWGTIQIDWSGAPWEIASKYSPGVADFMAPIEAVRKTLPSKPSVREAKGDHTAAVDGGRVEA